MTSDKTLIQKLVDCAIPEFYDSLLLLFTNCDLIPRFSDGENENNLVIIQGVNELSQEDKETIHLAVKKWQNQIQHFNKAFEDISNEITEKLNTLPTLIGHPSKLSINLLSKEIVEAMTSDFITDCMSKYHVQSDLFDNPDVIRQLSKKLGIIEPWSQASLCSKCEVFEILLSTLPEKETNCPRCNQPMKIIRVYKFNQELEKLKLENKDLPEFIKEYLSSILLDNSITSSYPLGGIQGGDIDVYIPKTKTGIECKLFVHPQAEGKYLHSCISELIKSLKKYVESGKSERLIAVINLDERYKEQIEEEIKKSLTEISIPFKEVKVVCYSVGSLLTTLDEEIQYYRSLS